MLACVDASKLIVGVSIYIQNVHNFETNFLLAKNKIVNSQLETKTIPCLELFAIQFGAEVLYDFKTGLTGPDVIEPIKIT